MDLISTWCSKCESYTEQEILVDVPVDIPPGEHHCETKCSVCGDISDFTNVGPLRDDK